MSFLNRIRLPLYLSKPQFPETKEVYTKSNGETKTLSASIKKTYALKTDWMPEPWHERLKVALLHDDVNIEGDKYAGGVKLEKMDEIDWQDFLDYPTAPVNGVVSVDPFFAVNSNCQTCEEFTQVELVDDDKGDVDEGTGYSIDVTENDTILCQPVTFEIVSFNSDYLENVSISVTGVISFEVKSDLVAVNGLNAIKYRATCANDQYDEADVYMNVLGTVEGCLAPTGLAYNSIETFTWVAPSPAPDSYEWALYTPDNLVTPIDSGNVAGVTVDVTLPDPATQYVFMVRSVCGEGFSNYVQISLTSPIQSGSCGWYIVGYTDVDRPGDAYSYVSYMDCSSTIVNIQVFNFTTVNICALQTFPAAPVQITGATSVTYNDLCDH